MNGDDVKNHPVFKSNCLYFYNLNTDYDANRYQLECARCVPWISPGDTSSCRQVFDVRRGSYPASLIACIRSVLKQNLVQYCKQSILVSLHVYICVIMYLCRYFIAYCSDVKETEAIYDLCVVDKT